MRAGAFTLVRDYSLWDQAYQAVMTDDRDWLYSSIGSSVVELDTFDLDLIYIPSNGTQFGWIETSPPQGQIDLLPQDLLEEIFALLDGPGAASADSRTLIAEFDGFSLDFRGRPADPGGWRSREHCPGGPSAAGPRLPPDP